jgi:predicted NAD/FAD-dependent oxidoreductase
VAFLHAHEPAVVDDIRAMDGVTLLAGWPERVTGDGQPCQPRAFDPGVERFAIAEGVSRWPKHLARGLDVRLETPVRSLVLDDSGFRIETGPAAGEAGESSVIATRDLVLALAGAQSLQLLSGLPEGVSDELRAARSLLRMLGSHPCLTLIAGYPQGVEGPAWDVCHPGDSSSLALVAHDSAKRPRPRQTVLVLQALPCWSRQHEDLSPVEWQKELLEEARRLCGDWAARPAWTQAHRWRYARTDPGSELAGPMLLVRDGGAAGRARLGLAGEMFHPGAGLEAAWMSGARLAARLTGEPS